jgi:hypothetical protein
MPNNIINIIITKTIKDMKKFNITLLALILSVFTLKAQDHLTEQNKGDFVPYSPKKKS